MGSISTESWGSQQWRLLRRYLRDGMPVEDAAPLCGMNLIEARLLAKRDAERAPLPEEAFALLYDPDAPRAASSTQAKEAGMARGDEDEVQEVKLMDVERFKRLYHQDIKPARAEAASQMQICSEATKVIKKECRIRPDAAKAAIKAFELEEVHGEDFFRGFVASCNALFGRKVLTYHANDLFGDDDGLLLVDQDEDEDGEQTASEPSDPIPFTEASEAEVAKQEGRGRGRKARQPSVSKITPPATGSAAENAAMLN